ncbi:hypothetical protein M3J09_003745 [Ascochyta lentis]
MTRAAALGGAEIGPRTPRSPRTRTHRCSCRRFRNRWRHRFTPAAAPFVCPTFNYACPPRARNSVVPSTLRRCSHALLRTHADWPCGHVANRQPTRRLASRASSSLVCVSYHGHLLWTTRVVQGDLATSLPLR